MPFQVLCNIQPPEAYLAMAGDQIELSVWRGDETDPALLQAAEGLWLMGHPLIDGAVMDTMPNLRVISNTGVGVDHIIIADAAARGIAVGNTPGFVDGATADLTFRHSDGRGPQCRHRRPSGAQPRVHGLRSADAQWLRSPWFDAGHRGHGGYR